MASLIPIIVVIVSIFLLIKWDKRKAPGYIPKTSPKPSGGGISWLLIVIGVMAILASMLMDASVETKAGGRVMNIGLMNDKQNFLIVSGVILLAGIILNVSRKKEKDQPFSHKSDTAEADDTKKCSFCAETIKKDARVCRFCGNDQPSQRWKI